MLLDIVILPPPVFRMKFADAARIFSRKIRVKFFVDNRRLLPHISLYHLKARAPSPVIAQIARIASTTKRLRIAPVGFQIKPSGINSYFGLVIVLDRKLSMLHSRIVRDLSKKRSGDAFEMKTNYSPEQRRNFKKYGSPNVLRSYQPHITACKFSSPRIFSMPHFDQAFPPFTATHIALAATDRNHQVTKVIKKFKLQ